jgi:hypothetical protein
MYLSYYLGGGARNNTERGKSGDQSFHIPFFYGTPVVRVTGLKRTSDLIRRTVEGNKEYKGKASMYYFSIGEDGTARSLV